jgi:UDP-N-acetylglucosamine/UDP-N-acetylgalactosamine diphosphorylase
MEYISASHKLQAIDQQQILQYWDTLSDAEQRYLLQQISIFDVEQFRLQRKLLQEKRGVHASGWEAVQDFIRAGNGAYRDSGLELLRQGKVGCLVVAGGQGTRLGHDGPKGEVARLCHPPKSLFQLLAEKTLAASKQAGRPLSLAIMTSPLNHKQTVTFFRQHDYFGLNAAQIDFFQQEMLPLLDQKGDLFLEERGKIAEGPDGNGTSLKHFVRSG